MATCEGACTDLGCGWCRARRRVPVHGDGLEHSDGPSGGTGPEVGAGTGEPVCVEETELVQCECWWTEKDETWGDGERMENVDGDCPVHTQDDVGEDVEEQVVEVRTEYL